MAPPGSGIFRSVHLGTVAEHLPRAGPEGGGRARRGWGVSRHGPQGRARLCGGLRGPLALVLSPDSNWLRGREPLPGHTLAPGPGPVPVAGALIAAAAWSSQARRRGAVSRQRTEHWGATPARHQRGWGTCRAGWPRRGRRPAAEALLGPGRGGGGRAGSNPLLGAGPAPRICRGPAPSRRELSGAGIPSGRIPYPKDSSWAWNLARTAGPGGGSGHSLPGPRKSSKVAFGFGLPSLPRPCYMAF